MFTSSLLLTLKVFLCRASLALATEPGRLDSFFQTQYHRPLEEVDCSNNTHRWPSLQGSCFDEERGVIPYNPPATKRSFFGDYFELIGLHPRDLCGFDGTPCWAVSCCQLGEVCGSLEEGCKVSWSTIYTTTITTSWSTITSWVLPRTNDVEYSTTTVDTTIYTTIFNPVTIPGEGQDDVLKTELLVVTTLVLSAFTPPAITKTETVIETRQLEADITPPPLLIVRQNSVVLPRAREIPRRWEGVSYTTLTVFITTFFTTSTTVTLENSVVEVTETNTISSIATRNRTHFETPTGFTTMAITQTEASTSYAYGTVETPTKTSYVTTVASSFADGAGINAFDRTAAHSSRSPRRFSGGEIAGLVIGLTLPVVSLVLGTLIFRHYRRAGMSGGLAGVRNRNVSDGKSSGSDSGVPAINPPRPALRRFSQSQFIDHSTGTMPESPVSELFFSGLNMMDENKYSRNHDMGSRLSRISGGSVISSMSPVPEEYILPETPASGAQARSSIDGRNWGRGYGGRGGYYNVGNRNTNLSDFGAMI
ncbi:hypothetical protein TWF718_000016 [Orbilia javanica]|uniref:Mid2 domain-containing protein n=1 Tax=Orbilia javanica TaxID=47235 RepID=A0AAN8RR77_9PEZI